jgi:holo-[acyl-carrier protein] synthase
MIFGIGTDITTVARFVAMYERNGERTLEKLLAPSERADCRASIDSGRFLAKRFAAKEALGKAFGTGIREPLLLPEIAIAHDDMGKPHFLFSPAVSRLFAERGLTAYLSLADEGDTVLAFVILEKND